MSTTDAPPTTLPPTGWNDGRVLDLEALTGVLVAASMVVLAISSSDPWLRVGGGGLLLGCSVYAVATFRRPRLRGRVAFGVLGTATGAALLARPDETLDVAALLIGIAFVGLGLWFIVRNVEHGGGLRRVLTVGAVLVPVGLALVVLADGALTLSLWLGAALITAHESVRLGVRLGFTHVPEPAGRPLLVAWVAGKGPRPDAAQRVSEQLFFETSTAVARTARFGLLMLFASVISAVGVLADSTAVVIGAMLIAPLINPMMGMALSMVMGWPARLTRSAALVLGGTAVAVGTGWLLAGVLDLAIDLEANTQITSRSSPGLADLLVAVAAGAGGAYALSRDDVSSSLPGVAVSIALVPPLSVIGIAAHQGDATQALGTALLFLTNLTAILLVGGVVFVLTGIAGTERKARPQRRIAVAVAATGVVAIFVVAALVLNSAAIVRDSLDVAVARRSVAAWLGPESDFTLVSVAVGDPEVVVVLAGPGEPPDPRTLALKLMSDLDHPIELDLQWIPRQQARVSVGEDSQVDDGSSP